MDIRLLGAHNCESADSKCISLLIDDVLVIDAGGLTSSLSFAAQQAIRAVLLTHRHFDHVRDIPALGMNLALREKTLKIYGPADVYEALATRLLDGRLYRKFLEQPQEEPTFNFSVMTPGETEQIAGYRVLAVPVNHIVPAVGYQVTAADDKAVFYTSDSGPGLKDCWRAIAPQLLITEVTVPNSYGEFARMKGHLTPELLRQELAGFREVRGYLPPVVAVHMTPWLEEEIVAEIAVVAGELDSPVTPGYEGMRLRL
ncbi:MBL fold metallo-hydrolase [Chloroflexota bacterium]